ncbi:hypothetical protein CF319_g1351 [Tilletia indica]|nr:hypothetical protein CF319_g1351 [Tilletia indica]
MLPFDHLSNNLSSPTTFSPNSLSSPTTFSPNSLSSSTAIEISTRGKPVSNRTRTTFLPFIKRAATGPAMFLRHRL